MQRSQVRNLYLIFKTRVCIELLPTRSVLYMVLGIQVFLIVGKCMFSIQTVCLELLHMEVCRDGQNLHNYMRSISVVFVRFPVTVHFTAMKNFSPQTYSPNNPRKSIN